MKARGQTPSVRIVFESLEILLKHKVGAPNVFESETITIPNGCLRESSKEREHELNEEV